MAARFSRVCDNTRVLCVCVCLRVCAVCLRVCAVCLRVCAVSGHYKL